jgi:methyl-accepting chemotaxis protein
MNKISQVTYLEADKEALDQIETAANNYTQAMTRFIDDWDRRNKLNTQRDKVATQVLQSTQAVAQAGINTTSNIANEAVQLLSQSSNVMISGLILALILGVILAVTITRAITKPLNQGVAFAREVANGNLEAEVDVHRKDEIGNLADALRDMTSRLKGVVREIRAGAENIASASEQMSSNSQEMSQGSSEQASSAEEVSSSMEEMKSNIQQNTENAQQTEKISQNAAESIKKGNEAAQSSVESMKEIADKISIINDIAFQTNILALNAAVEAARAGEHGKGFAVVASEVRKLAERSGEAAREIDEKSKSGVEISEAAGKQLSEIVPEVEKTSQLVQEITSASNEMNSGADQVNNAIQQLNQVTQQNASSSEELASNAEELSSQADQLKQVISFFRLSDQNGKGYGSNGGRNIEFGHIHQQTKQADTRNQQAASGTNVQQNKTASQQPNTGSGKNTANAPQQNSNNQQGAGVDLKMSNHSDDENFEKY